VVVHRNYVEPNWWARLLEYPIALRVVERVAPVRWILDPIHDAYKRVTHKPDDWYGWWEWMQRFNLERVGWRLLTSAPISWLLRVAGFRCHEYDLAITNHLRCAYCDDDSEDDCCPNRWRYVSHTTYSLFGEDVSPEVFQVEYDRFFRTRARGMFGIERLPRSA
jgi:hypothetical protein